MTRRNGSIVQRGERKWLVRWYTGTRSDARRAYSSKTIEGSRSGAKRFLDKIRHDRNQGIVYAPSRVTVNAHLDEWLAKSAAPRVTSRALEGYRSTLKGWVRSMIGEKRIDSLKPADVQEVAASMLVRPKKRPLAPRTVRIPIRLTKTALKQAVEWGRLGTNPAELVDLPKQRKQEVRALSIKEGRKLLDAVRGDRLGALFHFTLETGVRPDEALAAR